MNVNFTHIRRKKITCQWKSTLSSRRIGNADLLTHHCHAIFTLLKTGVVYFFLNSKRNIFERLASTGNLFMYLLSHFFIYLVIFPCPEPTPHLSLTFTLVSGDLRGVTLGKRNVAYTLFLALFKNTFVWLWPGQ